MSIISRNQITIFNVNDGEQGPTGPQGPQGPQGERGAASIGLGLKLNHSAFSNPNNGEVYIHGFDDDGIAADINGFIYYQDQKTTVVKKMVNPNASFEGYLVLEKSTGTPFAAYYHYINDHFIIKDGSFGKNDYVIDSSNQNNWLFIGDAFFSSSEMVDRADVYEKAKDYYNVRHAAFLASIYSKSDLTQAEFDALMVNTATKFFERLAADSGFFNNLYSAHAWIDKIQSEDIQVLKQIRSDYDISGNPNTPDSAGFWLGSSGLLKARFAELLGTLRTGLGAATNARVAIQDQSGIISGPDFTGAGVNDLNIVTEGSVAGDIKVEIDSVDNVRVLGWKAVYLATALGFSDAGIVGANGASDQYNSKALHAIGNTTSTNKKVYGVNESLYSSSTTETEVTTHTAPVSATYRFFGKTENFSSGAYSYVKVKIDGLVVIDMTNYNSSGGFTHDEDIYVDAGSEIEIHLEAGGRGEASVIVELEMGSYSTLFLFYDDDTSESISKDGSYRSATFLINGIDNTDIQDTYLTDTFRWTADGGSSWTSGSDINISSPYSLSGYNIEIIFTQQDGHALGDYWEFSQGNMKGMSVRDSLGNEYFQLTNGTLFATSLVGQIAAYATSTVPDGWLECNGASISRSAYSELFNAIGTTFGAGNGSTTFNIPDLRGEFIRGWDHSRGVDSGRTFGSYQGDAIRNITGYVTSDRAQRARTTSGVFTSRGNGGEYGDGKWGGDFGFNFDASRVVPTAADNRPRNRALMYCIKY